MPSRFEVPKSQIRHINTHTHTYTHTHTHMVVILRTSDQPVAENATYTTHNKHKRRSSVPSGGSEPAIPVNKRPHTYALDRTASGISTKT